MGDRLGGRVHRVRLSIIHQHSPRLAMSILACLEQVLGPQRAAGGSSVHGTTPHHPLRVLPAGFECSPASPRPAGCYPGGSDGSPDVSDSSSASSTAASSSPALSSDSGTQEVSEQSSSETTNDRQLKAENKCRSGRSKTQLGQEKKLGLSNIGNTCFLNSALQGLYGLPCFCSDITRQEALWSPQGGTTLKLLWSSREPDP
ncbi:unnamed protein product [Merluccius merluccius]